MLKQLMAGSSWLTLRSPDNEDGTPEHIPAQGDPHGDEVLEGGPQDPPAEPDPDATPEPVADATPPEPETPPVHKPDWRDKELGRRKRRLDEESARATAAETRAKAAETLLENLSQQPGAEPAEGDPPPPARRQPTERVYTQAEMDAEANRRAQSIAEQTTFQRDFASAVSSANTAYGKDKMQSAIDRISELGGLDVDHLNLVLGTDDPGKVLYELGSKPEEFQRIMDLPFNKRVVEFAKMGLKPETNGRKISNTPPPVEQIGGGGGSTDNRYNDKADDAAWFAAEEKRSLAAWKAKRAY